MPAPPPAGVNDRVLGRVVLLTGPEEFLSERVVASVRSQVRGIDAEAELAETTADQLTLATLGEMSAPSLFSSTRCVVVHRLEDLPEESVSGILDYAAAPADDVALVLVHSGGQKGSGVLAKLRKLGTVTEVASKAVGAKDLPGFVVNELRGHRTRIADDAADFLIQAVGQDLRALSAACSQLANDAAALAAAQGAARPDAIELDLVKRYFGGRAEVKSYVIADLTVTGQTADALEELRWALERGTAPVLVTSAIASGLRQLIKLSGARSGERDADLARDVGAPPWKLRTLRGQLRGWEQDALGVAVRAVARADAEVKGQASDPSYALERMVLTVSRLRTRS